MKVEIRAIQHQDAAGFCAVLDAVAKERKFLLTLAAPPVDRIQKFVDNNIAKNYPQFVALYDSQVIGWADFIPSENPSLKHSAQLGMGVIKQHRGTGVGELLLGKVTQAAIDYGFKRLELEVFANNSAAIGLYKKLGFTHEGTKRNARHIDGVYIDSLVMAKIIS